MRAHGESRRSGEGSGGPAGVRGKASEHPLLALQRKVGNKAVGSLLSSPRFAGVTRLEACAADRDRLAEGDQGEPVSRVQQGLMDLGRGYDLGRKGADGAYGPKTAAAIRRFKADERLGSKGHGDVGPGSMKRLDLLFAAGVPAPTTAPVPTPLTSDLSGKIRIFDREDATLRFNGQGRFGFMGTFQAEADIVPGPRQRFAEVRQLIRGSFQAGPSPLGMSDLSHRVYDGSELSRTEFKEDSQFPGANPYGHRGIPVTGAFSYSRPNQATGVHYRSIDFPGIERVPDVHFKVDLEFKLLLVDTRKDKPGEPEIPFAEERTFVRGVFRPRP